MLNFSQTIKEKREAFWKAVENGTPVVNVRCEYVCVMPGKFIDDLLYNNCNEEEDSDNE